MVWAIENLILLVILKYKNKLDRELSQLNCIDADHPISRLTAKAFKRSHLLESVTNSIILTISDYLYNTNAPQFLLMIRQLSKVR